jgi:ribosomal protein S18 acetylase RimI-like enzyme
MRAMLCLSTRSALVLAKILTKGISSMFGTPIRGLFIRPSSEAGATEVSAAETAVRLGGLRVGQLGPSDLPAVARHLLELPRLDRGSRFLGYPSDSAIAGYVRGIDPSHTVLIGAFASSDRIVGLAEAHPTVSPHTVEVAVSIDPALRRCGLGKGLVARALEAAFARGMQSAEFTFAPDNYALARLVKTLGGRIIAPGYALIDRSVDHVGSEAALAPWVDQPPQVMPAAAADADA